MTSEMILWALSGVFAVLWWLLRHKDEMQQKTIEDQNKSILLLFEKHDKDVRDLQELRLQIASQHYVKGELDNKFDKLETAFREGLQELGGKFDKLSELLIENNRHHQ